MPNDPGAHNPPDGCPLLRAQRRKGSTIPCSYEVPPPRWRVDPRVDRLVADRTPIGCWGASTWRPIPPRAPGLEAPADPAGRAHPGAGPGTGPQNRGGLEGTLLGRSAPMCRASWRCVPGTTPTPIPHRSQPSPTHSKVDDTPHRSARNRLKPYDTISFRSSRSNHYTTCLDLVELCPLPRPPKTPTAESSSSTTLTPRATVLVVSR